MNTTITVDKAGRIVLPKPVRDKLQLQAGDSLELQASGEEITLRPVRAKMRLVREDGMWVFTTGEPLPENLVEGTMEAVRREREEQILGKMKRNYSSILLSWSPSFSRSTCTTPPVKRHSNRGSARIEVVARIASPNFIPHLPAFRIGSARTATTFCSVLATFWSTSRLWR